jgi:hypothetical protein
VASTAPRLSLLIDIQVLLIDLYIKKTRICSLLLLSEASHFRALIHITQSRPSAQTTSASRPTNQQPYGLRCWSHRLVAMLAAPTEDGCSGASRIPKLYTSGFTVYGCSAKLHLITSRPMSHGSISGHTTGRVWIEKRTFLKIMHLQGKIGDQLSPLPSPSPFLSSLCRR